LGQKINIYYSDYLLYKSAVGTIKVTSGLLHNFIALCVQVPCAPSLKHSPAFFQTNFDLFHFHFAPKIAIIKYVVDEDGRIVLGLWTKHCKQGPVYLCLD